MKRKVHWIKYIQEDGPSFFCFVKDWNRKLGSWEESAVTCKRCLAKRSKG